MKLSDNLKRIRKDNNLSQEQLAEKLGVSRQAVSKWESGQSYPEMDKVLLICKLFNYNIDELMNENIKEVDETKQSKVNINKYVEDFFNFITKTIDMLSVMKFRQKIKCLMEQILIGGFLFLVFLVFGAVGSSILSGLLGGLYYAIHSFCSSIYIVFSLIAGITIMLHVFKIRYLDYYEIVKEENEKENNLEGNNDIKIDEEEKYDEKRKVFIEKKKEKIIIRDPEHSQSKFLNGLFRVLLSFVKFTAICIAVCFVFTFIALFCLLILSFMFVKTGLVFFGVLLAILSAIMVNFIILELFYNFITSKKSKKTRMAIAFVISVAIAGISIGMILIGITKFNYVADSNVRNIVEDVYEYKMSENFSINHLVYNTEYIETNSDKIKIVVKHSKYVETNIYEYDETLEIECRPNSSSTMEFIRDIIKEINNKQIIEDSYPEVYVYSSKENINKMKNNRTEKYKKNIEKSLDHAYQENAELQTKIYELKDKITDKNNKIEELEMQIQNLKVEIESNNDDLVLETIE